MIPENIFMIVVIGLSVMYVIMNFLWYRACVNMNKMWANDSKLLNEEWSKFTKQLINEYKDYINGKN